MKDITSAFRQEKNKLESAALITLYDIEITTGVVASIADYDKNIFFNGTWYYAFPVKRSDIDQNMMSVITSMTLSIANANRVYGGYLELYDGLIGKKVTVTLVFENLLGDPNSKIIEEYYVKSSAADQNAITLSLVSKLDIMNYEIPRRTFETNFCQWSYKGLGCWEAVTGGYTGAAGFIGTAANCDHTLDGASGCEWHNNEVRFGGFFSIPQDIRILRI